MTSIILVSASSGPSTPSVTKWVGGSGDFEVAANWNPSFAAIGGVDYYGNATIVAASSVVFDGPAEADLTSLTLAGGSVLDLVSGMVDIQGGAAASSIGGTIAVGSSAQLLLGGTISNAGVLSATGSGQVILENGVSVSGGTLSGSSPGGGFLVAGHALLNGAGAGNPVTLAGGAQVVTGAGDTLTLAGSIVNQATLAVLGNRSLGIVATLAVSGSVTLSGGGAVTLADSSGDGSASSQQIVGAGTGVLDNINNTISGYGDIGVGDASLTLINAAKGTIEATGGGGALVVNTGTIATVNNGLLEAAASGTLDLRGSVAGTGGTLLAAGGLVLLDGVRFSGGTIVTSGTGSVQSNNGTLDGSASAIMVAAGADVAVDTGDVLTAIGTIVNDGTLQSAGGDLVIAVGSVTNAGLLGAALGGVLDLRSNVNDAGGTIGAGSGTAELDGVTVTDGLLTTSPGGGDFIAVLGSGTLVGGSAVASGVTAAPAAGLLNTGSLEVQSGGTLTLRGTITNRGVINLIGDGSGNPPATLRASGTVALTGGGTIALVDSSGSGTDTSQIITGVAANDTLDNLNNTISGPGELGTGDGLLTLINEAAGTVDAADGTLIVNTGTNAVVNKGLMDATTGVFDLYGTISNTGTVAASGGSIQIEGATIAGGTLATSGGGVINANGSATLNGVTLAAGADVTVNGGNALTLLGSIANHATIAFTGQAFFDIAATLLVSGSVTLSGGGVLAAAFTDVEAAPGTAGVLDNINNTISSDGQIGTGDGSLSLVNAAGGTIEADAATLIVATGTKAIVNQGLLASGTGVLELQGSVSNTGGTIAANGGTTELDGATVTGGTFISSAGGAIQVLGSASLNGVTLAALSQLSAAAGNMLTLAGAIVNHGTLGAAGNAFFSNLGTVLMSGTVSLSGGGTVAVPDAVIVGAAGASLLDNIDNNIVGYGSIGAGSNLLKLRNEAGGVVRATGGALVVNTGTNAVTNLGTIGAAGGTLVLQGVVDSTGGGTLSALELGGAPGVILLDGGTLRGGTLLTDPGDPRSDLQETGNGGTLDGTAGAVTLAAGAVAAVVAGSTLTAGGSLVNHGTLAVEGNSFQNAAAELLLAGSVTLSGGGLVVLASTSGGGFATQAITSAGSGGALDNVDNLIAGFGQLGLANLKLVNQSAGVIEAAGGTLVVDTGTNVVSDQGLMQAVGGTLILRGTVDATIGGTIAAANSGTVAGVVLLDGATLEGGTIVTAPHAAASAVGLTANGGTLDGVLDAVSVAAGAHVVVAALQTLAVEGTLTSHGTLSVLGSGYYGQIAEARISGTVTLNGGGFVGLADASGVTTDSNTQVVTGTVASDTLRNVDNTIAGYGSLGAGTLTLANQAAGTIDAMVGTLRIDTGANSVTNQGLLEATAGTLEIDSAVANTGTLLGAAGGDVVIDGSVANGGLVLATAGGTVTVTGAIGGSSGAVRVAGGGMLVLAGGSVNGGSVSNAGSGVIDIVAGTATLAELTVGNAGTAEIVGNGYYSHNATLAVSGSVTLSGGGVLALADGSGVTTSSASQTITGVGPGATLDNVNNTISGYGSLGAGALTLANQAGGVIEATVGRLVLNTGSVAMVNDGLVQAVGGTLVVQSVLDSTGGGLVAAWDAGPAAGVVLLDGGTLRGGSVSTGPGSALLLTAKGGTLDGTDGAVTLAAGSQVTVAASQTLTLDGVIGAYGTLDVLGNGYYTQVAAVDIAGHVTLFNGSALVLADVAAGTTASATQVVVGTAPGAALTNTALISGYGLLGDGALALVNTATGTIEATGGTLVVNPGASAETNLGEMLAVGGSLHLESTLTNDRTIIAGAGGGVVVDGTISNSGVTAAGSGGTVTVRGTVAGGLVQVAGGGTLVVDGGSLAGGTLSNAGMIDITANGAALDALSIDNAGSAVLMGNGFYANDATLTVAGTTTLSGGGAVSLLDDSGVTTDSRSKIG